MGTTTDRIIQDSRISSYGRLVEAQRQLHRIFDRSLRTHAGLSAVWYEAMLRLARSTEGFMTINELGDALDLSSGGATRLVDRLEENGFIERVACPTDRRVSWIKLTDEGLQVLNDATRVHLQDLDEHFISRLTLDELRTLDGLLRQIRPNSSQQLP